MVFRLLDLPGDIHPTVTSFLSVQDFVSTSRACKALWKNNTEVLRQLVGALSQDIGPGLLERSIDVYEDVSCSVVLHEKLTALHARLKEDDPHGPWKVIWHCHTLPLQRRCRLELDAELRRKLVMLFIRIFENVPIQRDPAKAIFRLGVPLQLYQRVHHVFEGQRTPMQNLRALCESQGPGIPRSFTVRSFIRREREAQESVVEYNASIMALWRGIRQEARRQNVQLGNDLPKSPDEIVAWLEHPDHRPIRSSIQDLALESICIVPREITLLFDLQVLEIGEGNLTEIPDFLAELPLFYLDVLGNPIDTIPDSVYRHFEQPGIIEQLDPHFLFDREHLRRIPRRMWFRENCMLPNWDFPLLPAPFKVLNLPLLPFLFLFSLPFVLVNVFLQEVVERAITLVHDLLGHDRYVDV